MGSVISVFILGLAFLSGASFRPIPESKSSPALQKSQRYLVITRSIFADQLTDWKAERTEQGFEVVVRGWTRAPTTIEIKEWIKEQAGKADGICSYILLVGDCIADKDRIAEWHIPSIRHIIHYDQGTVEFVTDTLYGDLSGDGCPDVPVGRLAVQNGKQLKAQITKILYHKNQAINPEWFRAVIWMGAEGYMKTIRDMAPSMIKLLPKWMAQYIISGDLFSVYSGYIPDQPRVFLDQLNRPALLSFVLSHGSFRSITPANYEGKEVFLSVEDVANLKSRNPSGFMFLLGCDSGRFNMPLSMGSSLAEAFAGHPGGPIGVIAATGSTSPLTNYFMTASMIDQINNRPETIGGFILNVQRKLYREGKPTFLELTQKNPRIGNLIEAVPDREKHTLRIPELLRHEILMYNLIGDPSCKTTLPKEMPLSVLINNKGNIIISGETPTQYSKLFCQMIKGRRQDESLGSNLSKRERRASFEAVNQQPTTLLHQGLAGKKWNIQISMPHRYFEDTDYFRCIAIGREGSFVGIKKWGNVFDHGIEENY
jgi:hypothetical protein